MKKLLATICAGAVLGLMASCDDAPGKAKAYNQGINIIPTPVSLTQNEGNFKLNKNTRIYASTPEAKTVAEFFAAKMNTATGYQIATADKETSDGISLVIDGSLDVNDEGYTLDVADSGVRIKAKTPQGLFYGMQSFLQLLPAEIESPSAVKGIAWTAPAVSIKDEPRFGYRGIMLDPCRHFIPVENIKKQLDVLALFKINRMHWHLTDDQGWRIEIKKYPKLTEIGSKRIDGEGTEYGGFYTQEEVKDIVKYAADRFITIVPEIELPGHEMAAIAAYPELSCEGKQGTPRIIWGVEDIVLCAGKEEPFQFFEDVIAEVAPLFPGEYFHIGGDECPKTSWEKCPLCQARIRKEGLKGDKEHTAEEKLQSYFVQRMEKVVNKHGKKMIGWDEILEGGLAPSATVMSWRGEEGGIAAASMNHDVIMTPGSEGMYIDQFQGDYKINPVSIGGFTTAERVYKYNPVPDTLAAAGKGHFIKGVQCNVWSEYLYNTDIMEYRIYPRILALSEIAWSPLDRKEGRDRREPARFPRTPSGQRSGSPRRTRYQLLHPAARATERFLQLRGFHGQGYHDIHHEPSDEDGLHAGWHRSYPGIYRIYGSFRHHRDYDREDRFRVAFRQDGQASHDPRGETNAGSRQGGSQDDPGPRHGGIRWHVPKRK